MTGPVPPTGPVLAAAHAHGPGKSVRVEGTWRPPARPRSVGVALRGLDEAGPFGRALRAVLDTALAPRRWEPWAEHNDHRAYPSARASYLHTVALRLPGPGIDTAGTTAGIDTAARTVDPVRGLLHGSTPLPGSVDSAALELSVEPDRLRPGYGPLRDAIALLEAGHVLGALAEAAGVHGLHAATVPHPAALTAAALTTAALGTGTAGTGTAGAPVATLHLSPGSGPTWPRRRVEAVRSSGLGPCGLSADPRPWPAGALDAFAGAALRTPVGSPARAHPVRHRLLTRDGVYTVDPAAPPVRTGPAPTGDELRALFPVAASSLDVASLPVVWVVTADVAAAVAAGGPHAYPALLLAAGAAAQHVCSAAADTGLFCRPVRGVDEGGLEAALGAGAGEDVLYTLLVGRPRLPALGYDLTDPGALS